MRKILWLTLIAAILSTMASYSQAISPKEDTAQLTFSKTAVTKNKSLRNTYTVQPGDTLSAIIRRMPGIKEKDIPRYYRIIKELNPDIANLDGLHVGQTIVLPGKSVSEDQTAPSASNAPSSGATEPLAYRIKQGDSLIRIIHRELKITKNPQKILLLVQSLNPAIKNVNKIYAGHIIRLPKGPLTAKPAEQTTQQLERIEATDQVVSSREGTPDQETKDIKAKESVILPPEARLAVIKHIITQMNGTMLTSGNYYLPVSKTGQLTIDCSIIPVVELDDRTTIFLDFENRADSHLKKIISDRWENHHLVKLNAKDDIIVALSKIFKNSKTYELTKAQNPVVIGSMPSLDVIVDWLITKKDPKPSSAKTQGLRFVYENNGLLPRAILNYARWHSFIITEISPKTGVVGKPEEIYSLPPVTVLPTTSARDFSHGLLSYLNIPAEKDVDIGVFNINQDGFNLSIKADIAVQRGDKKTLIFSRQLPPQFVSILQKAGNEIIFVSDQDEPGKNMEKILRGFHFAFAPGSFTFSGLDKNQPPYHFSFSGTKIKTDKVTYVVNFDFNQELRGLMQEVWSANIVRY